MGGKTKLRWKEIVALAGTIKIRNDDDALELNKKTLSSPGASLLQLQVKRDEIQRRALRTLKSNSRDPHLDLTALALR